MARTTANVIPLGRKKSLSGLVCSGCGALAPASCNCGVPYIPAASAAAKAVENHPDKSSRAIAAEIGVSPDTVDRVRKSTARNQAVAGNQAPGGSIPRRFGKDGKTYPARRLAPLRPSDSRLPPEEQRSQEFGRCAMKTLMSIQEQLHPWLESNPKLRDDAWESLYRTFSVVADAYGDWAKLVAEKWEKQDVKQ